MLLILGCGKESSTSAKNANVDANMQNATSEDRQRLRVDSLKSLFYNTKEFLAVIESFSDEDVVKVYDILKADFINDEFQKVHWSEIESLRDGSTFRDKESEESLRAYFHYITKYRYFDYSGYDEFQTRRIKSLHSDAMGDPHELNGKGFYEEFDAGGDWRLGNYNFASKYFEINTGRGKRQSVSLGKILDTAPHREMWGANKYSIAPVYTNNPGRLRIYFENDSTAEAFKNDSKTMRICFRLKDRIIPEYEYSDEESTYMLAWSQSAKVEIKYESGKSGLEIFNNLSSEAKANLLKDYALRTNKPVPIAYDNRIWYHGLECEITSIEIQTQTLGTLQWKSSEWFLGLSIDDILTKERLTKERTKNAEMSLFSKSLFNGAKLVDIYFLHFARHNDCQIPDGMYRDDFYEGYDNNLLFEKYFSYFLKDIERNRNQLLRNQFVTKELSEFNQQYLYGLDSLYEICVAASRNFESHKIASWKDFWQTDSPKSKAGSGERRAIISALGRGWVEINDKYFNPVETSFTTYVNETNDNLLDLTLPWTLGESNDNQTGLTLFQSKKAPIIRIIQKEEIQEPDYQKDTQLYSTDRGMEYKDVKGGSDFSIGDEIVAINSIKVRTVGEYLNRIGELTKGDIVTLSVRKKGAGLQDIRIKIY